MNLLRATLLSMMLLAPSLAQAAAGQVLFALGRVEIQRNGQTLAAARGAAVEIGDVVSTGPTGLAQLRMQDGALLSLRYGSTMKVEDYRMPAAVAPVAGAAPATPAAGGGRSVLRLLRGAFRTVTGLIGKGSGDSYSVATPVATIGIRGTDYSAAYCSGDCGATADGLYLGVSNGGIDVTNDAGELALGDDEYGYVRDNSTPPERELVPPAVLDASIAPEREGDEDGDDDNGGFGSDDRRGHDDTRDYSGGHDDSYETGDHKPEGSYELRPGELAHYAYASGLGFKGVAVDTIFAEGDGALIGFGGDTAASIGTAANFDVDADGSTDLHWGRWHGGVATVTTVDGSSPLDLTTASLHWIYATDDRESAVLPLTGSQSYSMVGGTNPTDNAGNVGTLDNASLFADFTNRSVIANISVTMPGVSAPTTWTANGTGSITTLATFSGSLNVLVGGQTGGSGGFGGFLTTDLSGAGLTFEMSDAAGSTIVNGAIGFEAGAAAGGP